ncbi:hypothetical protein SDC9_164850 [bioreactor metagenome]|uniref:Uncharacterized protein n=1 Tax=bioreactor metagenome TaxID=1076179 RepID=A0A645FUN3_9ZZZZ
MVSDYHSNNKERQTIRTGKEIGTVDKLTKGEEINLVQARNLGGAFA